MASCVRLSRSFAVTSDPTEANPLNVVTADGCRRSAGKGLQLASRRHDVDDASSWWTVAKCTKLGRQDLLLSRQYRETQLADRSLDMSQVDHRRRER